MYELRAAIAEICRPTEPKISATVDRLEGADRQLLALRSYLRWGDDLASRWSCIGFVSQRKLTQGSANK